MNQNKILSQKIKEFEVQEFVAANLKSVGLSSTKLVPTPLGDKIIINASRPGLVVGRKGQSIKKLTDMLKHRFKLENPQIEINEVENINFDPQIVAERIANSLERFGTARFKGVGHRTMDDVMNAGALGVEILISGKVPSSRSKRWRFYQGYLKKCGQVSISGVRKAYTVAQLKTGTIGITVKIMTPDVKLPDNIVLEDKKAEVVEEIEQDSKESEAAKYKEKTAEKKPEQKGDDKKEQDKKKAPKKKVPKVKKAEDKKTEDKKAAKAKTRSQKARNKKAKE